MPTRRFNRTGHRGTKGLKRLLGRRSRSIVLLVAGACLLLGAVTVLWWSRDLPDPQNIDERRTSESTKIFDSTGTHLLYEIGEVHRTNVSLDRISDRLIKATLAAEDDQFYQHHGLDFKGILRGVILKPLSGQRAQGGSTITQQLIKNSILTPERTVRRKVKEAVLALELEQRFYKDQILEMYLNDIPYGSLAYGVEAAAQTFYGISAENLSLTQAATLAALPQAPSYFSPYGSHIEDLKLRQEHILNRMADLNLATREEVEAAKAEPFNFQPSREAIAAPHFVFYVKELLEAEYGERVVEQGGLSVITSLDMRLQAIAEETLAANQERLQGLGASNAALTAIDPKSGDILAMVGSVDYFNEEIDGNVNVAIRHRSPGSSIKPFVYATAFARGYTPDTILVDAETDFGKGYKPKNYNLAQNGPVTMRQALANSLNIPAVQTLYLAGIKNATDLAQAMGMTSLNDPDRYGLSLVLGGGEVRLVDEVSAYGVFANDGVRYPHRAIHKVESTTQGIIYDSAETPPEPSQVIDPQIARLTTSILSDNGARSMIFGSNSPLHLGSRPVAAKTGTTQEFRDGWTMGFTPSLAAGVWVGNNDNSPMGTRSDGVVVAGPIWNAFMREALQGTPIEQFVAPAPLGNLRHGVLRGELPEVKGKWVPETETFYTADCPIAVGQPRTIKELHSLLFYVRRSDPRGNPPADAEADPQFTNWEAAVTAWRDKHNEKYKTDATQPLYVGSLPTPTCEVGASEDLPKVKIVEPEGTTLKKSPVETKVEVDSRHPIREVRFLFDGQEIARRGKDQPFSATLNFDSTFSGRKTLQVLAITENNLIGRASRTFVINPDSSIPSITLHTPVQNSKFAPTNFPVTVKVTATDGSGIELVDILFTKDGESGTHRIGQIKQPHPSIPNRYETAWADSPGPGTYTVYAVAYDKTGNTAESARHTVTID